MQHEPHQCVYLELTQAVRDHQDLSGKNGGIEPHNGHLNRLLKSHPTLHDFREFAGVPAS